MWGPCPFTSPNLLRTYRWEPYLLSIYLVGVRQSVRGFTYVVSSNPDINSTTFRKPLFTHWTKTKQNKNLRFRELKKIVQALTAGK